MACPHRNPLLGKTITHFLYGEIAQQKRQHANLMGCYPNQPQSRNQGELFHAINREFVLVLFEVYQPKPIEVIDSRAQANRIGNVRSSRFKFGRNSLVNGVLKRHTANHVAAPLPGRHIFQEFPFPIEDTNPRRSKQFVTGKNIEIAV